MIYAGTGHRPDKLGGYDSYTWNLLVDFIKENLPKNTTRIISGMALGWDMALAKAAIELKIPFTAAIPFLGQEKRWFYESQIQYHSLLESADDVIYVCDQGYAAWKMQIRNEYMVDHCETVLALWNGSSGGTANCIKYAELKNKPILNLWENWNDYKRNK